MRALPDANLVRTQSSEASPGVSLGFTAFLESFAVN